MGWGYAQNTQILLRAEIIPTKLRFWSLLAITIAVCQIQLILTLIPPQKEHDGMGICAKHTNFTQSRNHSYKTPFLVVCGNKNCSASKLSTLTLIPLQNEHDEVGGIWAKLTNFIQSTSHSQKTPFMVVFGYNNSSVSNPTDFNTHTSST